MLAAGAVAGVVIGGASTLAGACIAVLACAVLAVGWCAGRAGHDALELEAQRSANEQRRTRDELERAQSELVKRLSMAVEYRDEDTSRHSERIGTLSARLAAQVGLEPEVCERLELAAPLHDVGKVAIPDEILLKNGPLTPEERALMETHAEEGYRILRGSPSEVLELAASIALSHQEKWNGTGYPRGLKGEAIPLEGRIVSIADVFDALTSDRVYRKAFPKEEAIRMMREQRGEHFDPVLLDAFMEIIDAEGADELRADPSELAEETLESFGTALERGDAESAEGAIVTAMEDGISPAVLHVEVIAPALRHTRELRRSGEIDGDAERRAREITRRVLVTLARVAVGSNEPTRERVLVVALEGDEQTLELQMINDQLAAAGYRTSLQTEIAPGGLRALVESSAPEAIVVGAVDPGSAPAIEEALEEIHARHPEIPLVFGGLATGGSLPQARNGARVLERIDEAVHAVADALAERA